MSLLAQLEPLRAVASLFYPPLCVICSENVGHEEYLCAACEEKAPRIRPPFCDKCSEQFDGAITGEFLLRQLRASPSLFRCGRFMLSQPRHRAAPGAPIQIRPAISSAPSAGRLVRRNAARSASARSSLRYDRSGAAASGARTRARLQSGAGPRRATQRKASIPVRRALERIRYTTTQTAFDRAERMENLRDAFRLRASVNVQDLRVLLIDDILTTGSTLSECARVLRKAGAFSVHAATAARA